VCGVIIPRHLPSCCIDIHNLSLLQKLSTSPFRLQIISLELVAQADTDRIHLYGGPVLSLPDTELVKLKDSWVSEKTLVQLLPELPNLRSFHWNVTHIPPCVEILASLQSCAAHLEGVRIHNLHPYGRNDVPDKWFLYDSPLWRLSNLTSFSFAVSSLTSFHQARKYASQLVEMLARCPMLEVLELLLAHDASTDLQAFFKGRWPCLKKLFLGGPEPNSSLSIPLSSKSDVQDFFAAHPALEQLYLSINIKKGEPVVRYPWDDQKSPAASFNLTSLASIELLHVPRNVFAMVASTVLIPTLKHLGRVEAEGSYLPRFQDLTQGCSNLTSLWLGLHRSITVANMKAFLQCVPCLERLYMSDGAPDPWTPIVKMPHEFYHHPQGDVRRLARGTPVVGEDFFNPGPPADPMPAILDTLGVLTQLTHLDNFVMFHALDGLDALVDPIVRQFAATLPRLAFLEVIITTICADTDPAGDVLRDGASWLAIQRDATTGMCIGWNVVTEEERNALGLNYHDCGLLGWPIEESPEDFVYDGW
ncbi:hypothetical protein C8R43DRAFT_1018737, partial [Mycena crocata]